MFQRYVLGRTMQYLFAPVASCGFHPAEADQSQPLSQRRQELDQMLKACDSTAEDRMKETNGDE